MTTADFADFGGSRHGGWGDRRFVDVELLEHLRAQQSRAGGPELRQLFESFRRILMTENRHPRRVRRSECWNQRRFLTVMQGFPSRQLPSAEVEWRIKAGERSQLCL